METRRNFLKSVTVGTCALCASSYRRLLADGVSPIKPLFSQGEYSRINSTERTYHISCEIDMFEQYDSLLDIWKDAGVTDAWLGVWYYGHFPYPWDKFDYWLFQLKEHGFRPHLGSVPFCHGGGSLDPLDSEFPNLPPKHWKTAKRWNGSENWGWSWHSPADVEGAEAIKTLYKRYGAFNYFLDDDFRFSSSPAEIGGCVCDECKADFLKTSGLDASRWNETLDDVRNNSDTPLLRAWVDYFCDRLTQCFRTYRDSVSQVDVGIMVMYMGCERGGIRLDDYRDALFRVGEGGFSDSWFESVKFKTIELFSSLFHRRFCEPGRAFSETTVFPERKLSAENMATKLSVSTISDVRNTCFMSGLRAIPPEYWPILSKRMALEKKYHAKLVGQKPRGPLKHYYGLASRYLSGENAYSLFLSLGTPFEVCDEIPKDGWTFLSDPDANEVERGGLSSPGSTLIARVKSSSDRFIEVPEDIDALFKFRRSIVSELQQRSIPYVEEETPIVLAWYPDVKLAYLWNLNNSEMQLHVRVGEKRIATKLEGRGSTLIEI